MKEKTQLLNQNLSAIMKDVNTLLKEKYNIKGLKVNQMNFGAKGNCPPGYKQVCTFHGNDPITGLPIIRCKCVKNKTP